MREPGPFERHVREAIALNRQRRPGYVRAGGARAALVSRLLVGSERALVPLARRLDRRAEREGSVEALASVLSPMSAAPHAARPVSGPARGAGVCARLAARLAPPLARADRELRRGGTPRDGLAQILDTLREASGASGLHLAMSTHLAESALLAASRIPLHPGPLHPSLATFVRLHLAGLPLALALDAFAAPLHARGVGLLANDLPPIPTP